MCQVINIKSQLFLQLLAAAEPKSLRLSAVDDEIYKEFKETFSDFPLDVLNENLLKTPEAKKVSGMGSYFGRLRFELKEATIRKTFTFSAQPLRTKV